MKAFIGTVFMGIGIILTPIVFTERPLTSPVTNTTQRTVRTFDPQVTPRVQTATEVVLTVPAPKKVQAVKKKEQAATPKCHVRDLVQGSGQVRVCDSV